MNVKPTVFLGFSVIIGAVFLVLLLSVLELESYYFDMNEELTITLEEDTKYMVLVDDMFQGVIYDVEQSDDASMITYPYLPGYSIGYSLSAVVDDGASYAFLDPYGDNTSVTVNDYDGIGTILLPAGDIRIQVTSSTTQTTEMSDSFEFALIPSSMIGMIIFTVLTGIGTIALLIVYIIMRSQAQKSYENDPYGYYDQREESQPQSDQDLFEMSDDDVFAQYDYNNNNKSRWDD